VSNRWSWWLAAPAQMTECFSEEFSMRISAFCTTTSPPYNGTLNRRNSSLVGRWPIHIVLGTLSKTVSWRLSIYTIDVRLV
jgi:hypothetical protein